MFTASGELKTTQPFDLEKSISFLGRFIPLKEEQQLEESSIIKAIMVGDKIVVFAVRTKENQESAVEYQLFCAEAIQESFQEQAASRISFFLSLQDDLNPFYKIAEKDPKFYAVVKSQWGFHHVKFPSLLETAVWAILSQRAPIPIAHKMKQRVIERFGLSLELDGKSYRAFPDYSRLKNTPLATLIEVVRNKRKAEYLSWLLSSYPDLDERFLKSADYETAEEKLKQIPGIGEWSARFILSRGLGRMERLSSYMKVVLERMREVYGPDADIEEMKRMYGEWIGYWVLYLWAFRLEHIE